MQMKLADIKIPYKFKNRRPSQIKLDECKNYYEEYKELDRDIVVNRHGTLIDGYVAYLILNELGVEDVEVVEKEIKIPQDSYRLNPTVYVYGKHCVNGREWMWRVPRQAKFNVDELAVGTKIFVNTKHGNKIAVITRIETHDTCPVDTTVRVRKVLGLAKKKNIITEETTEE